MQLSYWCLSLWLQKEGQVLSFTEHPRHWLLTLTFSFSFNMGNIRGCTHGTWAKRICTRSLMLGELPVLEGCWKPCPNSLCLWRFQPCMSTLGSESSCTGEMFPDKNDSLAGPGLKPWLFWIECHLSYLQQPVCSREATQDGWPLFINTWASLPSSSFHMLKLLTWHPNINGKCLFNTESYSTLALMSKP